MFVINTLQRYGIIGTYSIHTHIHPGLTWQEWQKNIKILKELKKRRWEARLVKNPLVKFTAIGSTKPEGTIDAFWCERGQCILLVQMINCMIFQKQASFQ